MNLNGNTIFITGGGSGIGKALAEALHKLGNKVIISGRRRGHLAKTKEANPGMDYIELDVSDPESIRRVAQELVAKYPALNVLVNNAGVLLVKSIADTSLDDFRRLSAVNVEGVRSALSVMATIQPDTKDLTLDDIADTSIAGTSP